MGNNASYIEPTRPELIARLTSLIDEAKEMSSGELCRAGNYKTDPNLHHPHTKSERIVDGIVSLMLFQSWADAETEPVLDEIFSLAGQLDKDVNQPRVWQELFQLVEEVE